MSVIDSRTETNLSEQVNGYGSFAIYVDKPQRVESGWSTLTMGWASWASERISSAFERSYNWDGQGSEPISPKAAKVATILIREMAKLGYPKPEFISVTSAGGVLFEWDESFRDLIIEIPEDGSEPTGSVQVGEGEEDFTLSLFA